MSAHRGEDFADFVEAHGRRLVAFAAVVCGSHSDAEDLTQDCLVRMAAKWEHIELGAAVAYAHRVLVRLHLNRARSAARERHALRRLWAQTYLAGANPSGVTAGSSGWLEPWLQSALLAMSPRQRTAVVLVYVWEYPVAEAADIVGVAPNTLKTHLARGLSALRAATPADPGHTEREFDHA